MIWIGRIQARLFAFAGAIALGVAGAAASMTVQDPAVMQMKVAENWWRPAPISLGLAGFFGVVPSQKMQHPSLPQLQPAARQVSLSVGAAGGAEVAFARGGKTLCSTSPFRFLWNGSRLNEVFVRQWFPRDTVAISLHVNSNGVLRLTLGLTPPIRNVALLVGQRKTIYNAAFVANVPPTPAAVPLPAALGLLASGLFVFFVLAQRRRRYRH